ncbi:fatty acid desaturase [Hyphococcus sp.]|uniref:fatty acid desaturase n=1 Tax=Hyphococcus sp. TaxID=2038636 RepID=UPI003CCBE222
MAVVSEHAHHGAPFTLENSAPVKLGAHGPAWTSVAVFAALLGGIGLVSALTISGNISYWIAVPVNAVCLYVLAHLNHEAFHANICGSQTRLRWLNESIGRLISFIFWFSMPAFRAVHFAHHRSTNDHDLDADMWMARKNPVLVALACLTLQMRYEVQMWRLRGKGVISNRILIEFYIERALAIALVAAAFQAGYGFEVVMLWLLPAYLTLPFLAFLFAYAVHHPHDGESGKYADTNVWITRAPLLQPLVTAVFVFQNYHLIHHLHPRIPFYLYGKTFRRIRPELEREGASIRVL